MILGKLPQRRMSHGPFKRSDGEKFTIESTLYETPLWFNYWKGLYAAHHQE